MKNLVDKYLFHFPYSEDNKLDTIINTVTHHIEDNRKSTKGVTKGIRQQEYFITKRVINALYLAYYSIPEVNISIPLDSKAYPIEGIGYKNIKKVYDTLRILKMITEKKGSEFSQRITRIFPDKALIKHFKSIGFLWRYYPVNKNQETIIVRDIIDNRKVTIETPPGGIVNTHRKNLEIINTALSQSCICLDVYDKDLKRIKKDLLGRVYKDKLSEYWNHKKDKTHHSLNFSFVQLKRIFARGSLKKGGRFYGGWWQSLPSEYRPYIKINGYNASEVDYSTMSLRILYDKVNISVPFDVDLYDIDYKYKNEKDKKTKRKIIKKYVNALINDEKNTYRLDTKSLNTLEMTHKELKDKVYKKYKDIAHFFGTDEGLKAQYLDSVIAEDIILSLLKEPTVVLPIHDSFLIREGHELWLREQMKESFIKFTKSQTNIKLKIDRPRKRDTFKKTDKEISQLHEFITFDDIADKLWEKDKNLSRVYESQWETWKNNN